jgi:cytoskeletal protein RodZ
MRQKIYDILPPDKIGRQEEAEKEPEEVEIEVKEETSFKKQKFKQPRKPLGKGFFAVVVIILLVCVLGGIYCFTDTRAEVMIYPKSEQMTAEKEIIVVTNDDYQVESAERFALSGKLLEDDQSYDAQIGATGSADGEGYAIGKIKVYNNSSSPLPLVKGTRFLSDKNSKIYRVQTAVNIPAGGEGLEIEVKADQPGEDYNIESSKFTVPGLEGGEYYSTTTAETVSAISGGAKGVGLAVSESDITGAKEKFKQQLLESIKSKLMGNLSQEYVVLDGTTEQEVYDLEVKAKEGDRVDSFDVSGKVKTKMIAVKRTDLDNLLKNMANESGEGNFGYKIGSMNISDLKANDKYYNMKISVSADYYSLDSNENIVSALLNKSKDEAVSILKKDESVDKVDISINPGWKSVISGNKDNVSIKISPLAD